MKKDDANIDEIYRNTFSMSHVPLRKNGWSKLSVKASKIKFWKFNVSSFNIYYATLITGSFIFTSGILINQLRSNSKSNTIIEQTITAPIETKTDIKEIKETSVEEVKEKPQANVKEKSQIEDNKNTIIPSLSIDTSTSAQVTTSSNDVKMKTNNINPDTNKPVVTVVRYKKVVVRDTVYIYNKKK